MIAAFGNDNKGAQFHLTDWLGTRRARQTMLEDSKPPTPASPSVTASLPPAGLDPTEHHFTGKKRDADQDLITSGLGTTPARWEGVKALTTVRTKMFRILRVGTSIPMLETTPLQTRIQMVMIA